MRRIALSTFLLLSAVVHGQGIPGSAPAVPPVAIPSSAVPGVKPIIIPDSAVLGSPQVISSADAPYQGCLGDGCARKLFESDHAFPNFIGPISSPVLSKDPRSLTEARMLHVSNWFPKGHPVFAGGDAQIYGLQARVALTERLTLIADKDGIARLHPQGGPQSSGFLNVAAGLKYTLLRDVEHQRLGAVGFQYEIPSGEAEVFQNHGSGVWTVFGIYAQEFGCWHLLINEAFQFGQNARDNSSFFFTQIHIDRQLFGWLYPLAEFNWYKYVSGGNRGIPLAVGEGDGLLNLGTSGMEGKDLATLAIGAKAKVGRHLDIGAAWETPLSDRKDLIRQRLLVECILRY